MNRAPGSASAVAWLLVAACAAAPRPPVAAPAAVPVGATVNPPQTPPPAPPRAAASTMLTDDDRRFLSDLVETRSYSLGTPVAARLVPDGSQVLFLRGTPRSPVLSLYAFDVKTGETKEILTAEKVLGSGEETLSPEEKARRERARQTFRGFTAFQLSEDGTKILTALSGKVFVIGVGDWKPTLVAEPDAKGGVPFDAKLSPDGKQVSFVRSGELWVAPATGGKARQLTRGSTADVVNAQAEFVAQEEMKRFTGYWWSPDSKTLAVEQFDQSRVEKMSTTDPFDPWAVTPDTRYPRPGKHNVDVRLGLIPARGGPPRWITWDKARYPYLVRVTWTAGSPLVLDLHARDQRDLSLVAVDPVTLAVRELVNERDDAWVEAPNEMRWLADGAGFLWSTDRGGQLVLELRAADGQLIRTLTPPDLGFREIVHVDAKARSVIVEAGQDPLEAHLHEISLDGGAPRALTTGVARHTASFASASRAHVLRTTGIDRDAEVTVVRADGTSAGALPAVNEQAPFAPNVALRKVGDAPGLWTYTVKPRDVVPGRKYPTIVIVYAGPTANVVRKERGAYLIAQWIADHGFIVVGIDGRGTPGRGRAWERSVAGKFADVPLEDQVAGLQALAALEPAIDLLRVGIMGSSFGGYMAALAVLRRGDVFRAAVASAMVSDWLDYDTYYTERYLGVPDEDKSVYVRNGLFPYVKDLDRPLLVVHGTADDNVNFSHSLRFADALIRAGKRFELLPLGKQTHRTSNLDLQRRFYERVFAFFREHL